MQKGMRRLLDHKGFVIVAIVYTLLLTAGSLVDSGEVVEAPKNFDKVLHLLAYFGLGLLWMLWSVFRKPNTRPNYTYIALIVVCAVFYGIFIEFLQGVLTTYRIPDGWDMLANTIGVVLALSVVLLLINKTRMLKTKF